MTEHFPPPRPATAAEVADLEQRMRAKLGSWLDRLPRASATACEGVFGALLQFDFERGRVPGQRGAVSFQHGPEFAAWEASVWAALDARQAELDGVVRAGP